MRAVQQRAGGALAVLLAHRGGDAHEVVALAREDGGPHAGVFGEAVDGTDITVQHPAAAAQHRRLAR